jgi:hypothetical protein
MGLNEPFPNSLCHRCEHMRKVETARSVFLRCTELPQKYAPQPVLQCPYFRATTGGSVGHDFQEKKPA